MVMRDLRYLLPLVLLAGCGQSGQGSDCTDGTCDERDEGREQGLGNLCEQRQADAYNPNHESFTNTSLRWSCKDVPDIPDLCEKECAAEEEDYYFDCFDECVAGKTGQEYCESFALVELPDSNQTVVRGQQPSADSPAAWSEAYLDLSDGDYIALDEIAINAPEQEVGACIFTSWQSDIYEPLPVCPESGDGCATYKGLELTGENFRMRHAVNSLEAAGALVADCLQTFAAVASFDGTPIEDPFTRGCLLNQLINRTSYRKSDTTVCTAALRLSECGCYPKGTPLDFPEILGSTDLRGFHLGSWTSRKKPPLGCHYVDTGDVLPEGRTTKVNNIVACPLTAGEVLAHASASAGSTDLKTYCDNKYADEVVVHVLVPPTIVECDPEASLSPFTDSCERTGRSPWNLNP